MAVLELNIEPNGVDRAERAKQALDGMKRSAFDTETTLKKYRGATDTVRAANDNFTVSQGKVAKSTTLVGTALRGATGAVLAFAGALSTAAIAQQSISQFVEFDRALSEVSTLIDGTADEMDRLDAAAKRMSGTFGGTATQQVNAFYQAISAGVGGVAEAEKFLGTANQLAVGGVTDITTSVEVLTSALNTYGDTGLTAARASDVLFLGVKAGKTTIDELSASLGKVLPVARSAGVSFDEVVAGTAALTTGGLSTAEAVTGLRGALASVLKPTKEAEDLAKQLGIQFDAAALASKGFAGFMDEVIEKTGGSTDALAQLFSSQEALVAVLSLATGTGETFNEVLAQMGVSAGTTAKAFEKVAGSPSKRLESALGKIGGALLEIGEVLLRIALPPLEAFAAVAEFAGQNAEVFGVALGVLAASRIPAVIAGLTTMVTWLGTSEGLFIAGAVAARGMAIAMNAIPFVAVTTIIAGMVQGFTESSSSAENYAGALDALTVAQRGLNAAVESFSIARNKENLEALQSFVDENIKKTKSAIAATKREIEGAESRVLLLGGFFGLDRLEASRKKLSELQGELATLVAQQDAYANANLSGARSKELDDLYKIVQATKEVGEATHQTVPPVTELRAKYGDLAGAMAEALRLGNQMAAVNGTIEFGNAIAEASKLAQSIGMSEVASIELNKELQQIRASDSFAEQAQGALALAQRIVEASGGTKDMDAETAKVVEKLLEAVNLASDLEVNARGAADGLSAASYEAANLAKNLGISLSAATSLKNLQSGKVYSGRGGDPEKVGSGDYKNDLNYVTIDEIIAQYQRTKASTGGGGGGSSKAERDLNRIQSAYETLIERLDPATASQNKFNDSMKVLDDALSAGVIGVSEYEGAVARLEDTVKGIDLNSAKNNFTGFFKGILTGAQSVTEAFANLAAQIGDRLITNALDNIFDKMTQIQSASGGAGGFLSNILGFIFSANGNVFSGGNVVPFANGGVVNTPTFFPLSGSQAGVMGEAGPEAIMPLKRGANGKLGVEASGQGGQKPSQVNIFFDRPLFEDVMRSGNGEAIIVETMERNGFRRFD